MHITIFVSKGNRNGVGAKSCFDIRDKRDGSSYIFEERFLAINPSKDVGDGLENRLGRIKLYRIVYAGGCNFVFYVFGGVLGDEFFEQGENVFWPLGSNDTKVDSGF